MLKTQDDNSFIFCVFSWIADFEIQIQMGIENMLQNMSPAKADTQLTN